MRLAPLLAVAAGISLLPSAGWSAEAAKKPAPARAPTSAKSTAQTQSPKPDHRMQCKIGPYEKQTRFVMETAKGKPVYVAYWSSNGPFRCSFESRPQDGYAQWLESSAGTVVKLVKGVLLIEQNGGNYFVTARDVDRMTYCGTDGLINGILTVPQKGGECTWKELTSEEASQLR